MLDHMPIQYSLHNPMPSCPLRRARIHTFRILSALLFLAAITATTPALAQNAIAKFQNTQQQADEAYENGHYAYAYQLYERLAKAGDKFSAFRIAAMHEDGHHVEQSLVEAYAWSYLAAETGRKAYRDYHEGIKQRLSDGQLQQARDRAVELIREYGVYRFAVETLKTLRGMLSNCAGSRVGSRCDKVGVTWKGCDIGVGKGGFSDSDSDRIAPLGCLRIGSLGLQGYNTLPSAIRQVQSSLNDFIDQYQPGRVELGDFELIEEASGDQGERIGSDDG